MTTQRAAQPRPITDPIPVSARPQLDALCAALARLAMDAWLRKGAKA